MERIDYLEFFQEWCCFLRYFSFKVIQGYLVLEFLIVTKKIDLNVRALLNFIALL